MKSFLLSLIAIGVIAYGANVALDNAGFSTREATTSPWVRPG